MKSLKVELMKMRTCRSVGDFTGDFILSGYFLGLVLQGKPWADLSVFLDLLSRALVRVP